MNKKTQNIFNLLYNRIEKLDKTIKENKKTFCYLIINNKNRFYL